MIALKDILKIIIIGVVSTFLQRLFLDEIDIINVYPDLLLIGVVMTVAVYSQVTGVMVGFFVGLMYDMLHGVLGVQAFSKTLIAFLAGFTFDATSMSGKRYKEVKSTGVVFLLGMLEQLIKIILYNVLQVQQLSNVLLQVLIGGVLAAVLWVATIKSTPSLKYIFY